MQFSSSKCPNSRLGPTHVMAKPATASYLAARPLVLGLAKVLFLCIAQLPLANAAPIYAATLFHTADKEAKEDGDNPQLWLYLTFAAALVLLGGAFAGLTIALMGQVPFPSLTPTPGA